MIAAIRICVEKAPSEQMLKQLPSKAGSLKMRKFWQALETKGEGLWGFGRLYGHDLPSNRERQMYGSDTVDISET